MFAPAIVPVAVASDTEQSWLVGCARTPIVYAVPSASEVGNVNAPLEETVAVPAPVAWSTSPEPERPVTVPPIVYLDGPSPPTPPSPAPPPQLASVTAASWMTIQSLNRFICCPVFAEFGANHCRLRDNGFH